MEQCITTVCARIIQTLPDWLADAANLAPNAAVSSTKLPEAQGRQAFRRMAEAMSSQFARPGPDFT